MLTLTRKAGETIWIGDHICITVLDISQGQSGGQVRIRIGIEAPREMLILRGELKNRITIKTPTHKKENYNANSQLDG